MEQSEHRLFVDADDPGVFDGRRCGQIYRLPGETPFPEKAAWLQYHDDGFFSLRRNHSQLDFACLDVEYGICRIPLREEILLLQGFSVVLPLPTWLRKVCGLNDAIGVTPTARVPRKRWAKFGARDRDGVRRRKTIFEYNYNYACRITSGLIKIAHFLEILPVRRNVTSIWKPGGSVPSLKNPVGHTKKS